MSEKVEESLPDWEEDPKLKRDIKCNACAVIVSEMAEALRTQRAEKRRKLTPDESVSALEWACGKVKAEYGLQMRNNKVTSVYSNDDSVSKAEGAWISGFLINGCGEVLGDYDDLIIAKHDTLPLHELQAAVCQGSAKEKEEEEVDDDDDDDDEDDALVGLGVCSTELDMRNVNTHADNWVPPAAPPPGKTKKSKKKTKKKTAATMEL